MKPFASKIKCLNFFTIIRFEGIAHQGQFLQMFFFLFQTTVDLVLASATKKKMLKKIFNKMKRYL